MTLKTKLSVAEVGELAGGRTWKILRSNSLKRWIFRLGKC